MLNQYELDLRIGIISGFNYFNEYDFGGYSYGYVKSGGIWGWATWKNRWEKYDFYMDKIRDSHIRKLMLIDITPHKAAKRRILTWFKIKKKMDKGEDIHFWAYQWGFIRHINSWLTIVPKHSQISNIGIGDKSTHSKVSLKKVPNEIAGFFYMKTRSLVFPLKHPDFIIPDRNYDKQYYKIIYPGFIKLVSRRVVGVLKKLFS